MNAEQRTWLSTGPAARYVGVSPPSLRALADKGIVPARRHGNRYVFDLADLDAYLEASRVAPDQAEGDDQA